MVKNVYGVGFLLFIATMLIFFSMYFFGMNVDYFSNSMLLNAFLLPAVYVAGAFLSVNAAKKEGVPMGFRAVFGHAFKPMFIGGLLSVVTMFLFLNFLPSLLYLQIFLNKYHDLTNLPEFHILHLQE